MHNLLLNVMLNIWLKCFSLLQAAKEFETELKKEPDSEIETPVEKAAAASEEEREVNVSSTKGSL